MQRHPTPECKCTAAAIKQHFVIALQRCYAVARLEDGVGVVCADNGQHLQLLTRLRPQRLQGSTASATQYNNMVCSGLKTDPSTSRRALVRSWGVRYCTQPLLR
jgi:hypothetical protein